MKKRIDVLDIIRFLDGLVFFAPAALLVRTDAGMPVQVFLMLQALLSVTIMLLEIPTGVITDKLGYRRTMQLSGTLTALIRLLLLAAFLTRSVWLFALEAVMEGACCAFRSGTTDAYLYSVYGREEYLKKSARLGKFSTMGFLLSTVLFTPLFGWLGLTGLLAATLLCSAASALLCTRLPAEKEKTDRELPQRMPLRRVLKEPDAVRCLIVSSLLGVCAIFIAFFYVDKLQYCGISEMMMTPVILGYSALQLLSERIIGGIREEKYRTALLITLALTGILVTAFGLIRSMVPVLVLMLVLPLCMDIPMYLLGEIQNRLVDRMGGDRQRAEILSLFSIGSSICEVCFLFVSSAVSEAGISLCFVLLGGCMLLSLIAALRIR